MNYGLSSIGLTDAALTGASVIARIEQIFDAMDIASELTIHVNADGNLANTCPETRGILKISKLDSVVASVQFTNRVGGKFYSGSFVKSPLTFSDWIGAMTETEEDADDSPLESQVTSILAAIGDISLVEHYGGTIVDILNKYTRQVLVDSSDTANKITLTNYFGNIQDISYDTPIVVQLNNNSVNWAAPDPAPSIEFIKDVYVDGEIDHTITEEYPLKMVDLTGQWNTYKDIQAGDMIKNAFYTLVKRTYNVAVGDPVECFVVVAQSGESEIANLNNRVSTLETDIAALIQNDTFTIENIESTTATIANLTNVRADIQDLYIYNSINIDVDNPIEIPNGMTVQGTTNMTTLIIGTSLNLSAASITLKANPGGSDLVNKSYIDTLVANSITNIMGKFAVGTAAAPATGTPGTFYFQLSS